MIFDEIKNLNKHQDLIPGIDKVCKFLEENSLRSLAVGRTDIDGDRVYVMCSEYETKEPTGRMESHRKYIDIHMVAGEEKIGYALKDLTRIAEYDEGGDVEFFSSSKANSLVIRNDSYVVFMPGEAHEPGLIVNSSSHVRKIVFKILAE